MRRFGLIFGILALGFFAVGLSGCSDAKDKSDAGKENSKAADEHEDHGDHKDHGDHGAQGETGKTDMEKMKAELAKLPPADAASAEEQHFCPVSGKMLGTMGAPKKLEVKGQTVWICCAACEKSLMGDPDKYLAKLNKK